MITHLGDTYTVRLRSLEWASGLVRELRHSKDADAVAVAAHWALDAVYDLFEIYWLISDIDRRQDDWLREHGGEVIGGLVFIRGEKTHRAAQVSGPSPFKALPYDFADLTHWVWAKTTGTTKAQYKQRGQWHAFHVADRPLWVPLDHAWYWFVSKSPLEIPGQNAQEVPGWIQGVQPICN